VADTPSKRERGLMFRANLDNDEGMLFRFPSSRHLSFYMKNTYIPLDIAFLDEDGTIKQISRMSPLNTKTIQSDDPCRYALEVNQGWFKNNNIDVGDKIKGLCFAQNMNPVNQDNAGTTETGNPVAQMIRSDEDKIDYAENRGLRLQIIYRTKGGHALPPRLLYPIPESFGAEGGKYPVFYGPNGKFFKAYDASPTISAEGYGIEGGQIKSYLFSGIIKLDVIGLDDRPVDRIRGMPETIEEENIYDFNPESETEAYQAIRRELPYLTVDEWDVIKDDVMTFLKNRISMLEIVDFVRYQLVQIEE